MKKCVFFLLTAIIFSSCKKETVEGTGAIITEPRNVENFYSVSVSGTTKVYITQGNVFEVKVKAYENIVPLLETKISDGILLIAFKANSNVRNDNSEVHITMPSLNSLAVYGNANISSTGLFLGSGNFKAMISGSGNIEMEGGTANNYEVSISGSGNVKSFEMVCQQAVVDIEGSGDAELTVLKNLNATIDGSGNVYVKGNPPAVFTKITGSGQVIKQ